MEHFMSYGKLALSYLPLLGSLVILALLLCMAGLPFLALVAQGLAHSRERGAYDKCARQLGNMACRLGIAAIVVGSVVLGMRSEDLWALDRQRLAAREHFPLVVMAVGWLCVVLSTVLHFVYVRTWQVLRTAPRLHQLLGFFAALASAAAVYMALVYLYAHAADPVASDPANVRAALVPDAEGFWKAVSYAPFAALALAGGYGALWLLLRRIADDYGRDHYNLVIPWCAAWARDGWLLLWLLVTGRAGWRVFQLYSAAGGRLDWIRCAQDAAGLIVLLLPALWWLGISRSAAPLRAKIATPIAPLWATGCLLLLDMGLR